MINGIFARLRSLLRGLRHRADLEAEMHEEFLHHMDLRTEDLVRGGLPRREAVRQARLEFGHIEGHKEAARSSRGLRMFDQLRFSWLAVKLGLRMLVKYPGLSLVAVFGMAVAIGTGGIATASAENEQRRERADYRDDRVGLSGPAGRAGHGSAPPGGR